MRVEDEMKDIPEVQETCKYPCCSLNIPNIRVDIPKCEHTLMEYIGLTQRYNYCTKCDEKFY